MFVPAFTGLGSPYWDPYARGTILGLTRGSGRAHLARAVVEAMAYQTRDVVDAVAAAAGIALAELRVDGGASVMDLLCQLQADLLGVTVRRPAVQETTALGAAYLAGIAEGVWASPAEAADGVDRGGELHARRCPSRGRRRRARDLAPRGRALARLGDATEATARQARAMRVMIAGSGTCSGSSASACFFVAYVSTYS